MNNAQWNLVVVALFVAGVISGFKSAHHTPAEPVKGWAFGALSFLLIFGAFFVAAGVEGG